MAPSLLLRAPEPLRNYVPVPMAAYQPVAVSASRPQPDVGLRWGGPSAFQWSSLEPNQTGGGAADGDPAWPVQEQDRYFRGVEVFRAFQKLEVSAEDGAAVPFERITEIIFDMGVYEKIEIKVIDQLRKQRIRVQTRHYISWKFPLHEGGTVVGTGERGERPEEPKPEPPTIGEEIRATKKFWVDLLGSPDVTLGRQILQAPG